MVPVPLPSRHVHRVAITAVVFWLVVAACGGTGSDEDTSGADPVATTDVATTATAPAVETTIAPNGETVEVVALDNSFRPETIEVTAGTAVRWENRGRNDHNVLPTDDSETWGAQTEDFAPGDEYTWVFSEPGTYAYYCSIHATKDVGMIGTVVVTG